MARPISAEAAGPLQKQSGSAICSSAGSFVKIIGEAGTGKTPLRRRLLAALGGEHVACYVPNPGLTPRTLLLSLDAELGGHAPASARRFTRRRSLDNKLLALAAEGKPHRRLPRRGTGSCARQPRGLAAAHESRPKSAS